MEVTVSNGDHYCNICGVVEKGKVIYYLESVDADLCEDCVDYDYLDELAKEREAK